MAKIKAHTHILSCVAIKGPRKGTIICPYAADVHTGMKPEAYSKLEMARNENRIEGYKEFVKWAAPARGAIRYAVTQDVEGRQGPRGTVTWTQYSLIDGRELKRSGGAFYDEYSEGRGAFEDAARNARLAQAKDEEFAKKYGF